MLKMRFNKSEKVEIFNDNGVKLVMDVDCIKCTIEKLKNDSTMNYVVDKLNLKEIQTRIGLISDDYSFPIMIMNI